MENKVIEILSGLRPEFDFTTSSNFVEDGMLDSFDIVTLVSELEENFSICIDGEDIMPENFSSVANIVNLIEKASNEA